MCGYYITLYLEKEDKYKFFMNFYNFIIFIWHFMLYCIYVCLNLHDIRTDLLEKDIVLSRN